VSAKKTDISQIRKYLNGELDARAMHQLEREAQDDPFLMDALEGYAAQNEDQQVNLEELQQRLLVRINQSSKKRILLWPVISIAASVVTLMAVGLWFYVDHSSVPLAITPAADKVVLQQPVASVTKVPSAPVDTQSILKPAISKPANNSLSIVHHRIRKPALTSEVEAIKAEPVMAMAPKLNPADSIAKDVMLKEVIVTGYASQRKKDITGAVSTVQSSTINTPLQSRVAGVEVKTPTAKSRMYTQLITGRVISSDDQKPLPGVSIAVLGKNKGAITDANGVFKIEAANNDNLKLGYIGYNSKQVEVVGDSVNVALNPNTNSLSEVVVTGYGASKDIIEEAHPRNGWDSFKKYLDEPRSPDNKKGKVRVRFVVNTDNTLSDFKITKSLSPDADAEAIRLIKEGPAWIHNVNGEPETVTVHITFK
jgi:CarboxypepD_reg-like domain/Gram-negative bacterial TonB protein C-terminal